MKVVYRIEFTQPLVITDSAPLQIFYHQSDTKLVKVVSHWPCTTLGHDHFRSLMHIALGEQHGSCQCHVRLEGCSNVTINTTLGHQHFPSLTNIVLTQGWLCIDIRSGGNCGMIILNFLMLLLLFEQILYKLKYIPIAHLYKFELHYKYTKNNLCELLWL